MKAILFLLLLIPAIVEGGELRGYLHTTSYHFNNGGYDFNNYNPGIALNYKLNYTFSVESGMYYNSFRETSVYGAISQKLDSERWLEVGLMYGAVTGYFNRPVIPMAALYAEISDVIRITLTPDPAIGVSFKY